MQRSKTEFKSTHRSVAARSHGRRRRLMRQRACWLAVGSNGGKAGSLQMNKREKGAEGIRLGVERVDGGGWASSLVFWRRRWRRLLVTAPCITLMMLLLPSPVLLLLLLLLPVTTIIATVRWHTVALLLGVAAIALHILGGWNELWRAKNVPTVRLLIASMLIALLLPGCSLHALRVGVYGAVWALHIRQPHLQKLAFNGELV